MASRADGRWPAVTVVGSYAAGLSLRVPHHPAPGETCLGREFEEGPGGKGSNQAVQAARLGAAVTFVAAVGHDRYGDDALSLYAREGVSASHVVRRPALTTGVGFIVIDDEGENTIVLDPGANESLGAADVDGALVEIADSGVVITQLEIPAPTAFHALRRAREAGAITVLNPAPARPVASTDLALVDVVTPNEGALLVLLGRAPRDASDVVSDARRLLDAGVGCVVVTRGALGAVVVDQHGAFSVASPPVAVVDSTGAGDAFNGTLAVQLAAGHDIRMAVTKAVVAGALACTRVGVVPALPDAAALEAAMLDLGRAA